VPSIAPPPKVPTSLFQEGTPSRFNPFDQEPNETNYKIQGIKIKIINYNVYNIKIHLIFIYSIRYILFPTYTSKN